MTKDPQRLWEGVTNATDGVQAVQTLTGILADKKGRVFISRLGSKDAELCVEILDDVSHNLHSPHSPQPQTVSSGYHNAQPQTRREADFLRHVEETRRVSWTTAGSREDNWEA